MYFHGFVFVVVVFSQLNKILLLEIIIERLAPYFSLVPRQWELHKLKLCSESSLSTMLSANVVWMLLD